MICIRMKNKSTQQSLYVMLGEVLNLPVGRYECFINELVLEYFADIIRT